MVGYVKCHLDTSIYTYLLFVTSKIEEQANCSENSYTYKRLFCTLSSSYSNLLVCIYRLY